jgi:hypothetical protein
MGSIQLDVISENDKISRDLDLIYFLLIFLLSNFYINHVNTCFIVSQNSILL